MADLYNLSNSNYYLGDNFIIIRNDTFSGLFNSSFTSNLTSLANTTNSSLNSTAAGISTGVLV